MTASVLEDLFLCELVAVRETERVLANARPGRDASRMEQALYAGRVAQLKERTEQLYSLLQAIDCLPEMTYDPTPANRAVLVPTGAAA